MFPITVQTTINNAAQLQAFNAFVMGVAPETVKPTVTAAEVTARRDADQSSIADAKAAVIAEKKAAAKKPAAETASSPSGAAPLASEAPAQESAAAADAPTRTIDQAKDLTMKIVAAKGRDAAVALLTKYGVPVAAKLAADQVGAFCADADAVLAS